MLTTHVSTLSLMATPRTGTARMQTDLAQLNKEVIDGRVADVGLSLGTATGQSLTLHLNTDALASFVTSNNTVAARLTQTQSALDKLSTDANDFLQQLVTAKSAGGGSAIGQAAQSALSGFVLDANASDGANYLFAGINTSVPPIADYDSGPQAAVDAAFLAKFGVSQSDPAAANIPASAISDFIDNEFAQIFADPAWGTTWSTATDQTATTRISPTETASTSVSANDPAMRKLAMVYTMVASIGGGNLSADARNAVLDKATSMLGDAINGVTAIQANVGTVQDQITSATTRLTAQQNIIQQRIGDLEGVDAATAKTSIDTLSTQIEMSYSLTAKLLQMSILNYVPAG